jgi:hypothetical protein
MGKPYSQDLRTRVIAAVDARVAAILHLQVCTDGGSHARETRIRRTGRPH